MLRLDPILQLEERARIVTERIQQAIGPQKQHDSCEITTHHHRTNGLNASRAKQTKKDTYASHRTVLMPSLEMKKQFLSSLRSRLFSLFATRHNLASFAPRCCSGYGMNHLLVGFWFV
jgi:hypothetical protein